MRSEQSGVRSGGERSEEKELRSEEKGERRADLLTRHDDLLDLADVAGRRTIETHFAGRMMIREENAAAALEVMSRFAADPRWLIYLPPTMSPCEASPLPEFLEHPAEAFGYFQQEGVERVVCEQKHMGSRAIVIVCKDVAAATRRFGVRGEGGIVYTRTGRRFFDSLEMEAAFLALFRERLTAAEWWAKFNTDWFAFDGELMPWSAKAQELLRRQYAATGSAGGAALAEVNAVLSIPSSFAGAPPAEEAGRASRSLCRESGSRGSFCRRVSPLLLAGELRCGSPVRSVLSACDRGETLLPQYTRMAHANVE